MGRNLARPRSASRAKPEISVNSERGPAIDQPNLAGATRLARLSRRSVAVPAKPIAIRPHISGADTLKAQQPVRPFDGTAWDLHYRRRISSRSVARTLPQ